MELIGYLDSPFVRRVAITMRFLGIEFNHRELSIFRSYDEFRKIHPSVKVPLLICDDGEMLIDSSLIIDYLERQVPGYGLMPEDNEEYRLALQITGIALAAMEKVAQLVYETSQRPEDKQHGPWVDRIEQQLEGSVGMMEAAVSKRKAGGHQWLAGEKMSHADIAVAVAWRFTQHIDRVRFDASDYPALAEYSAGAEALPEFLACPLSS